MGRRKVTVQYAELWPPGRERSLWPDSLLVRTAEFADLDMGRVHGMDKARKALLRWTAQAAEVGIGGEGGPESGIILSGDTGVGKTHMILAAARNLAALLPDEVRRHNYRVLAVGEEQLHQYVRGCWSRNESTPERLRRALAGYNRSWLFLDDLGVAASDKSFARELADVLMYRHASRFPALTVITTNLSLDEIGEHYGERLASRLGSMLLAYPLDGEDQRRPGGSKR